MERSMIRRSIKDAIRTPGITLNDRGGLNVHFNSIINWYILSGSVCPICSTSISWHWSERIPVFTREEDMMKLFEAGLKPESDDGEVRDYGHRWIKITCNTCKTELLIENFDKSEVS